MSDITRRQAIQGLAAAAAAAKMSGCTTSDAQTDSAAEVGRIDHVVILCMENRSYDHYFGARSLEEGEPSEGLTGDEVNYDSSGVPHSPRRLPEACIVDPAHGWDDCHEQHNEGANDKFVEVHETRTGEQTSYVMDYLNREDLPISYALADAGCLPDQWFCSVLGPTWPNRLYLLCGTSEGMQNNDWSRAPFTTASIMRKLEEVGLDWRCYYGDAPFMAFHTEATFDKMGDHDDFVEACQQGTLPPVTFVDPAFTLADDHPPHHHMMGQLTIGQIYQALAESPLWERCLFIITYDEHGGFHDHVSPPAVSDDHAAEGFTTAGFRVPALVLGPWVKQGVISDVLDNASVLTYLCERFGIEPWTERMRSSNSVSVCLDLDRMARNEPLPPTELPRVDFDPETLPDECFYDFGAYTPSGQPELEAYLRQNHPELLRNPVKVQTDFWRRAEKLGLLRRGE